MSKQNKKKPEIKTRDWSLVALICGATKSGIQKDEKREASRKGCRGRYRGEE